MPQSHISKIENAGVDLRISSLTEIARALDLELMFVPRKAVPAVRSIVRGVQPEIPSLKSLALADDLVKLEELAARIAQQQGASKEAIQLKSRIHDLTRFEIPDSYLRAIRNLNKQLKQVYKAPENLKQLVESLDDVQALRNALAQIPSGQLRQLARSAYSLEDGDG